MAFNKFNIEPLMSLIGLKKVKAPLLPTIWRLGDEDCSPFFSPDVKRRYGCVQIFGVIGVWINPFEDIWKDAIQACGFPNRMNDTFLLGSYLTGLPQFFNPPIFRGNCQQFGLNEVE